MPRPRKRKSLAVEKWRASSSHWAVGERRARVRRSDPTHDGGAVMDGAPRFVALDGAAKDGAPTPSEVPVGSGVARLSIDRKSTRLNSSHRCISYAVFCLKKNK